MTAANTQAMTGQAAIHIGRLPRMISSAATAMIISIWIGPLTSALWLGGVLFWELAGSPRATLLLQRLDLRHPIAQRLIEPGVILAGALFYVWGWALAWLQGDATAFFIAGLWFAGSLLHGLFYFSGRRLEFMACCGPAIVVGLVAPWLMVGPLQALACTVVACFMLMTVLRGMDDRNRLLERAVKSAAAQQAAERANQQKSRFLASMSHELRTPLTAVIGYAELIQDEMQGVGGGQTASDAERIRLAALHLLGLVNEVLDLAKIEAGRMEVARAPVHLPSVFAEVEAMLRPIAAANETELRFDAAAVGEGRVMTDAGKLKQCLLNLGGNACKFTEKGVVEVRARLEPAGMLRVDVRDTGPGIAPEVAERLFQPFEQGETPHSMAKGGTGLGLVITRGLVELLGGTVTLDSAPGRGSTFTLTIAAAAVGPAACEAGAPATTALAA